MKISSNVPVPPVAAPTAASEITANQAVAAANSIGTKVPVPTKTESAALDAALASIRDLPEVDQAKVATLRDQLTAGDIPFDASKLASLIDRYHRTGQ